MKPLVTARALRLGPAEPVAGEECLAEEAAVALQFNGVPFAVMMATPADLHDYAVGMALAERIIDTADELSVVDCVERESGVVLHLRIPQARFAALEQRRALLGTSGCGLCGVESLDQAMRTPPALRAQAPLAATAISSAMTELARSQPLNDQCGALHAAAAITDQGLLVREDVGRHNAVDKVIGAMARQGLSSPALLVTSRASFELVHKTATAQIPILAAVSAPTAQALRLAQATNLTLLGFVRDGRLTCYSGAERLHAQGPGNRVQGPGDQ